MSNPRVSDTAALVRLLVGANVEFIVVGMSAAMTLLASIGAFYRHDMANRGLAPTAEALAGQGHQNLQTDLGPLDLLCQLEDLGYEDLLPRTVLVTDGALSLRVLDLPALIEVKTRAARPKDKVALPLLLATLDERRRRGED